MHLEHMRFISLSGSCDKCSFSCIVQKLAGTFWVREVISRMLGSCAVGSVRAVFLRRNLIA